MPTPRDLATTHQYAYILERDVAFADRDEKTLMHRINRVSVFVRTWNGKPRPTSVVASTLDGRSLMAATLLPDWPIGPNDDPRLLALFADHIADAEHRATLTRLEAAGTVTPMLTVDDATRLHPAYATGVLKAAHAVANLLGIPDADDFTPADLGSPVPATAAKPSFADDYGHICQHGNRLHPCRCAATADHSSRVCVEADRG